MTSPLLVQTSIVVKSTEANTSQWASRKAFQDDCRLRSGARVDAVLGLETICAHEIKTVGAA